MLTQLFSLIQDKVAWSAELVDSAAQLKAEIKEKINSDEVITFVCVYEDSKYRQMALISFDT